VLSDNITGVPAAAALAKAADVTVLVLGTDTGVAMENHDAVNITFSKGQLALIEAVADASAKPVVVVRAYVGAYVGAWPPLEDER
jgi:hypothetical protein